MLNVRLNKELEKRLKAYSEEHQLSKTDIVKEALALYFKKEESDLNPFELGADLFGTVSSGQSDNSYTYKSKIKKKLNEKHSH